MDLAFDKALRSTDKAQQVSDEVTARCRARAKEMLAALAPKQRAMVVDPAPHVSALCPRRAGKTFAAALAALITGELRPGAISLIISLNLKQLRRLYWSGSASGLYTLAKKFKLNLVFNSSYLRWEHENGSVGYLLGCDDEEQMEAIRGMEADLYVIDECKSFAPGRLALLIDDILDPQRGSRDGRIIMIGTPGFLPAGPFYEATCPDAVDSDGKPFLIVAGTKEDAWKRSAAEDLLWSFHHWALNENQADACKRAYAAALKKKKQKKWGDDHPTWLREYIGVWTYVGDGMVFRYTKCRDRCTWIPLPGDGNPAGLPPEGAPWRFIAGLDFGYEAPTAFVVCAYSRRLKQLRHVYDVSAKHLLVGDIAELICGVIERFGHLERIFADAGNLGTTILNTLVEQYGLPLEAGKKREKLDYIELLNAGFESGEVLIVEKAVAKEQGWDSLLAEQLITNAWELGDDTKEDLARLGKLVEDKSIPNDSSDALVYCYRGSLHMYGLSPEAAEPEEGTPEYFKKWEREQLAKVRQQFAREAADRKNGVRFVMRSPHFIRRALQPGNKWTSIPSPPIRLVLTTFATC